MLGGGLFLLAERSQRACFLDAILGDSSGVPAAPMTPPPSCQEGRRSRPGCGPLTVLTSSAGECRLAVPYSPFGRFSMQTDPPMLLQPRS